MGTAMSDLAPTVVMIDDDASQLRVLEGLLAPQGYATHSVNDSRNALAEVRLRKPRVVLLDINMPHFDGYQIARQIRSEAALEGVLIVAVSSVTGSDHDREVSAAGIDCQLSKPVSKHDLVRIISAGLRQRRN